MSGAITSPETNFTDSRLDDTNLRGIDFTGVNFTNANLMGAMLRDTILVGTNFHHANLTGADLADTLLTGTIFTEANLLRAIFPLDGEGRELAIYGNTTMPDSLKRD